MRYVFLIGPAINDSTITGTDWRASSHYLYVSIINEIGTSQVQYTVAIKATNLRRLCLGFQHDCKAANGKASRECGGMKTAQSAHSRGRRIQRTWRRRCGHMNRQMWIFRCWWSLHRGWSCGSSRCLRTTRMSNGCDTRLRRREHTRSRWVYCCIFCASAHRRSSEAVDSVE